jgi:hypothetical protein
MSCWTDFFIGAALGAAVMSVVDAILYAWYISKRLK